jgi:hypothetical protein
MTGLAHAQHSTQVARPLAEIADRIFARIDSFVLDIGAELQYAFEHHRADYDEWVETSLPFSLDKARRMRMIHKAFVHLPPDVLERMPRAWQSLYAISRLAPERVIEAVDSGEIHENLTVAATNDVVRSLQGNAVQPRHSVADVMAGKLVTQPVSSLGPEAEVMLRRWLDQSS